MTPVAGLLIIWEGQTDRAPQTGIKWLITTSNILAGLQNIPYLLRLGKLRFQRKHQYKYYCNLEGIKIMKCRNNDDMTRFMLFILE